MGTISDKLSYLVEVKNAIKTAIINKGVEVSEADTFMNYADKIEQIGGGGGGSDIHQYTPMNTVRSTSSVIASGTVI